MLVLSRKQNQQIIIGNDIKITILKIRGKSVRIGIEAPRHIHVARGEIVPAEMDVTLEFVNHDHDGTKNTLRVFPADKSKPGIKQQTVEFKNPESGTSEPQLQAEEQTQGTSENRLQQIVDQVTKN